MDNITDWYEFVLNGVNIDELPMPEKYSNWIKLFQEHGQPALSAETINQTTGIPLYYVRSMQRTYAKIHSSPSLPENEQTEYSNVNRTAEQHAIAAYNQAVYPLMRASVCENQVETKQQRESKPRSKPVYRKPKYYKFTIYETVYIISSLREKAKLDDSFYVNDLIGQSQVDCKKNLRNRINILCKIGLLYCERQIKENRYTVNENVLTEFLNSRPYKAFLNLKFNIEASQQRQALRSAYA